MPLLAPMLCLIVGITDGGTLTARSDQEQHTIRLAEIDAPESKQPFGRESRARLRSLCFQQQAVITPQSKDRYGRTIARVSCKDKDASFVQAERGLAWAFTRYLKDPQIKHLGQEARTQHRGLWSKDQPEAPWD